MLLKAVTKSSCERELFVIPYFSIPEYLPCVLVHTIRSTKSSKSFSCEVERFLGVIVRIAMSRIERLAIAVV